MDSAKNVTRNVDREYELSEDDRPDRESIFRWYIESIVREKKEGETLDFEDILKEFLKDWSIFKVNAIGDAISECGAVE